MYACRQNSATKKSSSPHAIRRFGDEILVELWHSEQSLRQHRDEADRLHEHSRVYEHVHEEAAHGGERQHELHVRLHIRPLPEVVVIKVCKYIIMG